MPWFVDPFHSWWTFRLFPLKCCKFSTRQYFVFIFLQDISLLFKMTQNNRRSAFHGTCPFPGLEQQLNHFLTSSYLKSSYQSKHTKRGSGSQHEAVCDQATADFRRHEGEFQGLSQSCKVLWARVLGQGEQAAADRSSPVLPGARQVSKLGLGSLAFCLVPWGNQNESPREPRATRLFL